MTTSLEQGVSILFRSISEKIPHIDFKKVTDLSNDYKIYTTGENAASKLLRFTPRETPEQFEQRVRLTQVTTPDIVGVCTKPMYKVGRTPAGKIIKLKDEGNKEKRKELVDVAGKFYGNQSVDQYLSTRMVELDATDPNSFIVVEFTNEEGTNEVDPSKPTTKAMPYPFEVGSQEAYDYYYDNNTLQYLTVKTAIQIKDDSGKKFEGCKFTMYLPVYSVVAEQIHKTMVADFRNMNPDAERVVYTGDENVLYGLLPGKQYILETKLKGEKEDKFYIVNIYEHKIPFVPAQRVGCVRDLTTFGRTRVPLIHQAKAYLEKAIKTISEFDLTNCLHVFPQKIQYSEACMGYFEEHGEERVQIHCNKGVDLHGNTCKSCKGSGYMVHKSASDLIQIAMPSDPRDMASLENFLVYKHPPTELLEFQKSLGLYEFRELAQKAVYNSEVFSKEGISKTATEEKIDLDSVYDTLKPFADGYSDMWVFIMMCIASLRDIEIDVIQHRFPTDFKMKSVTDLLNELRMANENQASSHIREAITRDIMSKYYADNPYEILRMNTKEKFMPFSGKNDAQIALIMASDTTSENTKILFSNFDEIFSELEYDSRTVGDNGFYSLDEKKQRELIQEKVAEFRDRIEMENGDSSVRLGSESD